MSIEALYAVRFGHAGTPNLGLNGGVVVLETDRIFGGDSWFAYTGHYQVSGSSVVGTIHAVRHMVDPNSESAWGTQEDSFEVSFTASSTDGYQTASGTLNRPGMSLALRLVRTAELP